jgi:RsiW-degrading membrane proteinase PrsW (M82 family)
MNQILRLLIIAGLVACAIAIFAIGMARHNADLLAPLHLMLFVLAILVYLFPASFAVYRDCKSTAWIAVVNILLGWTILGWAAAMGWAAAGKTRPAVRTLPPPAHPVMGH